MDDNINMRILRDSLTWEEALRQFQEAWTTLQECPDKPCNDESIALEGLKVVLPLVDKCKLLYNYRYREFSAINQFNSRLNSMPRSIHGSDGRGTINIEVKTGGLSSSRILSSSPMGMFDKVHARLSSPIEVPTSNLREAINRHDKRLHEGSILTLEGVSWSNGRGVERVREALQKSEASGDSIVKVPAILRADRLTSSPDVNIVNFCLFLKGGVEPVLTVEATTESLERHLAEVFEKAGEGYYRSMAGRSTKKAPSARDSVNIKLSHLVEMRADAKLVHLDTRVMSQRGVRLADNILDWALSSGSPEIRERLKRLAHNQVRSLRR